MRIIPASAKLDNVSYDIRGPVLKEAKRLEAAGQTILKLNIGNPAAFGFYTPDTIINAVVGSLRDAEGYCDSKGLLIAREAVARDMRKKGVEIGAEDVYIGNGVSELIMMSMSALLDNGDEALIPAPDYPLWSAAVSLAGGTPVYYRCDEARGWNPDIADIEAKITPRTKALIVINPNNPTGAVYDRQYLEAIAGLAAKHGLIIYADEIYDRILYDDAVHIPMAAVNRETLTVTFNGFSKTYRAAGFRTAWLTLSGDRERTAGYIAGIDELANMRMCANVPPQFAIPAALAEDRSIDTLTAPGGRLREQRDLTVRLLRNIPGVSVVEPRGALYCFPRIDTGRFGVTDDEQFVMELLRSEQILFIHGRGFHWFEPDHFRIVFLPDVSVLEGALSRLDRFLRRKTGA